MKKECHYLIFTLIYSFNESVTIISYHFSNYRINYLPTSHLVSNQARDEGEPRKTFLMCRFPQRNIKKEDFPQRKVSPTMLTRVNNFRLSKTRLKKINKKVIKRIVVS